MGLPVTEHLQLLQDFFVDMQIFKALLLGPFVSMTGSRKMLNVSHRTDQNDLVFMKGLLEAGNVRPVIDRQYPLNEAADALRYYGEGHTRGKIVITV